MFPPIDKTIKYLALFRSPGATRLVVFLPCGDSYRMGVDDLVLFLNRLGVQDPEDLIGCVWNFYNVYLDIVSGDYIWMQKEKLERIISGSRMEKQGVEREIARVD